MRGPLHILWRKAEGRASTTTACTGSSPTSTAADPDDIDERVRVASFTLLWPTPTMVEDAGIFGELSQNTKNGAGPYPR
jgi:hypothetical protein